MREVENDNKSGRHLRMTIGHNDSEYAIVEYMFYRMDVEREAQNILESRIFNHS